jgi:hypothetical protein
MQKKRKYKVLVGIDDDHKRKRYEPGDVVKDGDFPSDVIQSFLQMTPPVLILIEEDEDGEPGKE